MSDKMSLEQAQKIFDEYIITCRCNKCKAVKMIIAHHKHREEEAREENEDLQYELMDAQMDAVNVAQKAQLIIDTITEERDEALATLEKLGGTE